MSAGFCQWCVYKIARSYVHHAKVAAATYAHEGGDDFVREHRGLGFGVRRVCRPCYSDELVDEVSALDFYSLAPRELMDAQGVVVEELVEGVDEEAAKKLKYPAPDVREHDVETYLAFDNLEMVERNLDWSADNGGLSEEEQARCDAFAEAHLSKCEKSGDLQLYNIVYF